MAAFLKKHDIKTHYSHVMDPEYAWMAYMGDMQEWIENHQLIEAPSKKDAIYQLARQCMLPGWDTLDWR